MSYNTTRKESHIKNIRADKVELLEKKKQISLVFNKPNFSYIVHPSNHYEEFIVSELLRLERIETNEFNHVSKMIEESKSADELNCKINKLRRKIKDQKECIIKLL